MFVVIPAGVLAIVLTLTNGHNVYTEGKFYYVYEGLTEVPSDIPVDADKVFLYDSIYELKKHVFVNLFKCTYLQLDHNTTRQLERGAFTGLGITEYLDLSYNGLLDVTQTMWEGLYNLKWLSLANNKIQTLSVDHPFSLLRNLNSLILSGNQLTAIVGDIWMDLGNLVSGWIWVIWYLDGSG